MLSLPAGFVCQTDTAVLLPALVTGPAFHAPCSHLSLRCPMSCLAAPALPFDCRNSLYSHSLLRRVPPGRGCSQVRSTSLLVSTHLLSRSPAARWASSSPILLSRTISLLFLPPTYSIQYWSELGSSCPSAHGTQQLQRALPHGKQPLDQHRL